MVIFEYFLGVPESYKGPQKVVNNYGAKKAKQG